MEVQESGPVWTRYDPLSFLLLLPCFFYVSWESRVIQAGLYHCFFYSRLLLYRSARFVLRLVTLMVHRVVSRIWYEIWLQIKTCICILIEFVFIFLESSMECVNLILIYMYFCCRSTHWVHPYQATRWSCLKLATACRTSRCATWKGIEMVLMAEAFEELVRGLEYDGGELHDMPLALPLPSDACSFNSLGVAFKGNVVQSPVLPRRLAPLPLGDPIIISPPSSPLSEVSGGGGLLEDIDGR